MQVLSSLSSIPFYAPSAGFAPTNSTDVSAIASAYQVVSATATQLYAGTAYVTSVNDAPISAARAGNAANASMANSAYYDGTGRLISALPDSATVSAIASSYAESAASGKLDKTAQVVTAIGTGWNSDDDEIVSAVNGFVLSADEARYAGAANSSNYARYDRRPNVTGYRDISSLPGSAEVSAIASAYAESAASSKLDATAYDSAEFYTTSNPSGFVDATSASAIASAYQVVSSVGTSQNGPKSIVTGINGLYISARYADTANEARKDGSGRTISSLPDSAAVSAIASAYAESAASSKQDTLTFGYDAEDKISGINGSAIAGGEGGGTTYVSPSGTVWISGSSIEGTDSAYVPESAQQNYTADDISVGPTLKWINEPCTSLKVSGGYWNAPISVFDSLDTLVTSLPVDVGALYTVSGGTPPYKVSSEEWSTMDYSAYGDPTIIPAKCIKLAHASASSNYYTTANESGYALSSDVSATVDLVGTQSANWGGSALALSAGPGVKFDKVGNTLVASTDETVLWSASGYVVGDSSQSITLSESPLNFNTVRIYGYRPLGTASPCGVFSDDIDIQWLKANSVNQLSCPYTIRADITQYMGSFELSGITSTTWVEGGWHCSLANTAAIATNGVYAHLHKVIGINRTAEA